MGTFETVPIHLATPPDTYPPIFSGGGVSLGAATLVGAVAGAVGGATWVYTQRFESSQEAGAERIEPDGRKRTSQPSKKED